MTEQEWLSKADPGRMIAWLQNRGSDRKLRLLACAYARHIWPLLTDERSRNAVVQAERFADGAISEEELRTSHSAARKVFDEWSSAYHGSPESATRTAEMRSEQLVVAHAVVCALNTAMTRWHGNHATVAWFAAQSTRESLSSLLFEAARPIASVDRPRWEQVLDDRHDLLRGYLHDVFGNPFRPMTIEATGPGWRENVVQVARGIYEERSFSELPILADALEEAGCDNEQLIEHCRGEELHARGCWAVDLVLGLS